MLEDWAFARAKPTDKIARIHQFSVTIEQGDDDIEFIVTVREHEAGDDDARRFVASTDKETNQGTAPYKPTGWGANLVEALSCCVREIHRFPYEGT